MTSVSAFQSVPENEAEPADQISCDPFDSEKNKEAFKMIQRDKKIQTDQQNGRQDDKDDPADRMSMHPSDKRAGSFRRGFAIGNLGRRRFSSCRCFACCFFSCCQIDFPQR